MSTTHEPANVFKHSLSKSSYVLLNKLILDLKSTLPISEQVYDKKDNASLIYNLFRGNYEFSYNQYNEIINCIFS